MWLHYTSQPHLAFHNAFSLRPTLRRTLPCTLPPHPPSPRPLQGNSEALWRHLSELFDLYLLYCFSAFGGMGLEDLVWRDDLVSPRLKGALLRILTAEGSRYRTLVGAAGRCLMEEREGGRGGKET